MNCPTCSASNPAQATTCSSCGTPLHAQNPASVTGAVDFYSPSLASGTKLKDGAFAIGEVLGQGGFGITYKGGDVGLRRYVAIKEFFPHGSHRRGATVVAASQVDAASFEAARKGFIQEAMTLARFNHPAIVRVFGAFEENNTAYMVMELLEGHSLQKRLDDKGVLIEKDAIAIVAQVGAALEAVHAAKLLHRDIKPDNIVLTDDGRVVLIDFGTAREFAADKTRSMTAMVTHGYAPLEQYGKQAKFGPYTDVYALGATLYHCLTGQLPVSAMDRVAGVELLAPDRVNPNLSRAVSQATMRALGVKASERYQSIAEFTGALDAALNAPANPIPAPSVTPPSVPPVFPGVLPIPNSTQAGPVATACPHCGAVMASSMAICVVCHQHRDAPVEHGRARGGRNAGIKWAAGGVAALMLCGAVVMPMVSRERGQNQLDSCQRNLKQLGLGLLQYSQDYDEKFPLAALNGGGTSTSAVGWADALQPYVKSTQILQCPSGDSVPDGAPDPAKPGYTDYFYNRSLGESRGLAAIKWPSSVFMLADGKGEDSISNATYSAAQGIEEGSLPQANALHRRDNGGSGGANVLFVDGHVEYFSAQSLNRN